MKTFLLICLLFVESIYAYDLTVKVENLRNNKGDVLFSLYNDPTKFPDEKLENFYKQGTSDIVNNQAVFVFHNLSKNRYVVNILHDENKNKKIDKGFVLPTEGVGLSNYKTINLFNRPNFKDGSFVLDNDKTINVIINYF